jgi:hypothetical protein
MSERNEAGVSTSLEKVFRSELFGRPRVMRARVPHADEAGLVIPTAENTTVAVVRSGRETNQRRVVAALSGVAAAALAVAGIAVGSGQPRSPNLSAAGQRIGSHPQNGGASTPVAGNKAPAAVVAVSMEPRPLTPVASQTGRRGSGPAVVTGVNPDTTVTAAPPSMGRAGDSSSSSGGTGVATGVAPLSPTPPGVVNAVAPVTAAVGTTATSIATTVTVAADQLPTAFAATSPVSSAVDGIAGTVGGLGQAVSPTTS